MSSGPGRADDAASLSITVDAVARTVGLAPLPSPRSAGINSESIAFSDLARSRAKRLSSRLWGDYDYNVVVNTTDLTLGSTAVRDQLTIL